MLDEFLECSDVIFEVSEMDTRILVCYYYINSYFKSVDIIIKDVLDSIATKEIALCLEGFVVNSRMEKLYKKKCEQYEYRKEYFRLNILHPIVFFLQDILFIILSNLFYFYKFLLNKFKVFMEQKPGTKKIYKTLKKLIKRLKKFDYSYANIKKIILT